MTILKSLHRVAYQTLPHSIVENYKGEEKYQVFHFFNDTEIFIEFFKVVVEPDSTVLDCGLNFGMHTDMVLKLGAKNVFAFDVFRRIRRAFTRSIRVHCSSVTSELPDSKIVLHSLLMKFSTCSILL